MLESSVPEKLATAISSGIFFPSSLNLFMAPIANVSVKAKIALIENCYKENIRITSSMGTGNKLSPEKFEIADIYKTSVCPLARVLRRELKTRGIKKCTVLYSKETPQKVDGATPGSVSFVPSVAGLMIAGYVIKELVKEDN